MISSIFGGGAGSGGEEGEGMVMMDGNGITEEGGFGSFDGSSLGWGVGYKSRDVHKPEVLESVREA